ncbi:YjbE family putative metal transport protein [Sphingopyxis sp. BSN-002]|uniref:YjbE family putative metal transport protein n=1 Tax=Sphingopyxis sp. BSN-002 TaxID=2911495 RepID=UPI001EDAED0B|nr:YjbE family putative metal transport protein [Sphingopyxis sp. BSN-002]UKK83033.1 YjbE family putative metal transport protein [Sphingopyxis sp. BSN-002]
MDFSAIFTGSGLILLGQIIIGDLTMAGDNVLIMGTIAGRLPERERKRVLMLGVGMALVFLVTFATIATQLLKITGLVFAGGLLLLWVAYNMYREIRPQPATGPVDDPATPEVEGEPAKQSFLKAAISIMIADLSMSIDNVLLVASIARENPALLFVGMTFTVLVMGLAANYVAKLLQRYHWIAWVGLVVILYVALKMIYDGWVDPEIGLGHLFGWVR